MTVTYSRQVALASYGSFVRLLFHWRGSVYKIIWPGLFLFCLAFSLIATVYQLLPSNNLENWTIKLRFVQICAFAKRLTNAVPISFMLGFYVNLVVDRWWQQFFNWPTPDLVATLSAAYISDPPKPKNERVRKMDPERPLIFRRSIIRYLNLSTALCFSSISLNMKKRFSSLESMVAAGLMTEQELEIYVSQDEVTNCFYIPLVWAIILITKAHHEKMIWRERHLDALVKEMIAFWEKLYKLLLYDWINIPLVYNQVVALAIYTYFLISIFANQFIDPDRMLKEAEKEVVRLSNQFTNSSLSGHNQTLFFHESKALNVYPNIPLFTILAFISYNGWLTVAESHILPFGLGDNSFDVVPLLERNINVGMFFVDHLITNPKLLPISVLDGFRTQTDDLFSATADQQTANQSEASLKPPCIIKEEENISDNASSCSYVDNGIPELPPDFKRRASRFSLAGSVAHVFSDDIRQEISRLNVETGSQYSDRESVYRSSPSPWISSVGTFIDRIGRRASKLGSFRYPAGSLRSPGGQNESQDVSINLALSKLSVSTEPDSSD